MKVTLRMLHAVALFLIIGAMTWVMAEPQPDRDAGQVIYEKRCSSCHGKKGEGARFMVGIPNLADPETIGKKSDDELLFVIANGRMGTRMPKWKGVLNQQDMKNVLSFIRSLAQP